MLNLVIFAAVLSSAVQELPPEACKILESKGFHVSAIRLRHAGESEASQGVRNASKIKSDIKQLHKELADIEQELARTEQAASNARDLSTQWNIALTNARSTEAKNQIVARLNVLTNQREKLHEYRQQLEKAQSERSATLAQANQRFIDTILQATEQANSALTAYAELDKNPESKHAIDAIASAIKRSFNTTPPGSLQQNLKKLNKLAESIQEQSVTGLVRGNTLQIPVTIGTANQPVDMIVDSGASIVCISNETAKSLQIQVPDDAPQVTLKIADGSEISARRIVLPLVRVGRFETQNVEAAVLGPEATGASCLLGMSFLRKFNFAIDLSQSSLILRDIVDQ